MNCKQGDLAVIVRSTCGNEGVIVQCLELVTDHVLWHGKTPVKHATCWRVDRTLPHHFPGLIPTDVVPDDQLRPIRDSDCQDEILRLVGLPNVGTPQAA